VQDLDQAQAAANCGEVRLLQFEEEAQTAAQDLDQAQAASSCGEVWLVQFEKEAQTAAKDLDQARAAPSCGEVCLVQCEEEAQTAAHDLSRMHASPSRERAPASQPNWALETVDAGGTCCSRRMGQQPKPMLATEAYVEMITAGPAMGLNAGVPAKSAECEVYVPLHRDPSLRLGRH